MMRLSAATALSLFAIATAMAQTQYTIRTIAGAGRVPFSSDGVTASTLRLLGPQYVAVDQSGNFFVSDSYYNRVLRISADGSVASVAGGDAAGPNSLNNPTGIAVSPGGELYICDTGNFRVRKVAADGAISVVVGNGRNAVAGDNGPATAASIGATYGIAFDATGNYYLSDGSNNTIRRVDAATGVITTVAGAPNASGGYSGDNGPARQARLNAPRGLAVDPSSGNLYIADQGNHRIRRLIVATGIIDTFAGTGVGGFSGDNGPAAAARITFPTDVKVADNGTVFISDRSNGRVRRVTSAGIISSIRITPESNFPITLPLGIALEARQQSILVVNDVWRNVARIDLATSSATPAAGNGAQAPLGENGPATDAYFISPWGVAVDPDGNVLVADTNEHRIRRISAADGTITTIAGNGQPDRSGDGGLAATAAVGSPFGMSYDAAGNLYITTSIQGSHVRKITPDGIISTFAGIAGFGYNGDDKPATGASLFTALDVISDPDGNVYIADTANQRVRRVDGATGFITTVAGNGTQGYSGDDGPATAAQLDNPSSLAIDGAGNLYIADTFNNRVRMVERETGLIRTYAGTGVLGATGDGGPSNQAQVASPRAIRFDVNGNLLITQPARIRSISPDGVISTIAGVVPGAPANGGPDSLALGTGLANPVALATAADGSIYVVENGTQRVRKLEPIVPAAPSAP